MQILEDPESIDPWVILDSQTEVFCRIEISNIVSILEEKEVLQTVKGLNDNKIVNQTNDDKNSDKDEGTEKREVLRNEEPSGRLKERSRKARNPVKTTYNLTKKETREIKVHKGKTYLPKERTLFGSRSKRVKTTEKRESTKRKLKDSSFLQKYQFCY